MQIAEGTATAGRRRAESGAVPVPREHGAWVILAVPAVLGLASAPVSPDPWLTLLLAAATVLAFLGREAVGRIIRRRSSASDRRWAAACAAGCAAAALPLLAARPALAWVALAVTLLFAGHSLLVAIPARKRLDRSVPGELLGAAALSLGAVAGRVVAGGAWDGAAWVLWLACTLYFAGGVFFVKMLLAGVKLREPVTLADRLRVGRRCLVYHAFLVCAAVALAAIMGSWPAWGLIIAAFAPAIVRAARGVARLSPRLPRLVRVGIGEMLYTFWFAGLLLAAIRAAGHAK
ncbi:MAG: YwiC-like family protein [Chthonomonadales bacterium]|nr:YwiC-like family protein [Chthonomonadales bacterium]